MLDPKAIEARIQSAFPDGQVKVVDYTGTGDHFEATVVSPSFAGKSMIEQHQAVYAPVQDLLKTGELHALKLKTYTPEQWQKSGGAR